MKPAEITGKQLLVALAYGAIALLYAGMWVWGLFSL